MRAFSISILCVFAGLRGVAAIADDSESIRAVYTVPTDDPALIPFASIAVTLPRNYLPTAERPELEFRLPRELAGGRREFELRKMNDGTWAGDGVTGKCTNSREVMSCSVAFSELDTEPTQVEKFLRRKFGNGEEFKLRREVSRLFTKEPIGIFRYPIQR